MSIGINKLKNTFKRSIYADQLSDGKRDWFDQISARMDEADRNFRNLVSSHQEYYAVVYAVQEIKDADLGLHVGCGAGAVELAKGLSGAGEKAVVAGEKLIKVKAYVDILHGFVPTAADDPSLLESPPLDKNRVAMLSTFYGFTKEITKPKPFEICTVKFPDPTCANGQYTGKTNHSVTPPGNGKVASTPPAAQMTIKTVMPTPPTPPASPRSQS